ncbi:hypothetical protein HI850_001685 [bacterium SPL81]|nr:hypothetical protein [Acinetobacter baumannii]
MIGQQRNILATLGIDVWIPRDIVCQKNTASALWRDQNIQTSSIQFDSKVSQNVTEIKVEHQSVAIKEVEPLQQKQEAVVQPIAKQSLIEKEQIVITAQIQSFELQMYVLDNCAILLESSQLNDAQRILWHNIQKAKLGQYAELKWPFPLAVFQESRGLSSYIQGFLDATATSKKILCLGQLDFIQHSNILHLASLEGMLAQPVLKKRLWQLMQ